MSAVILSLCYQFNKLGAAFYDEAAAEVHVLHDISDDQNFSAVLNMLREIEPSVVIVSKVEDTTLVEFLCRMSCREISQSSDEKSEDADEENVGRSDSSVMGTECNGQEPDVNDEEEGITSNKNDESMKSVMNNDGDNDNSNDEISSDDASSSFSFALHLMPKIAYDYDSAKKRICLLYSKSARTMEEQLLNFSLNADITAVNMVRALGALLKYLDAIRLGVEFEDYSKKTPVNAVKVFSINQSLEIDRASFEALHIFQNDTRSSIARTTYGRNRKEGLSLFYVCNRCKSQPGKSLLREWFEHPIVNRNMLLIRQKTISFFVQDCNADSLSFIFSRVKHVTSVKGILKRARGGRMSVYDWKNLFANCNYFLQLNEYILKRELPLGDVTGNTKNYVGDIERISTLISELVDFGESTSENRVVMNREVNEELDKLKNVYRELPESLRKVAREEAERLNVEACSVGYVPMFGYLLELPANINVSDRLGTDLELVYELPEKNMKHYKSLRMHELDEQIGDIKMEILDIEATTFLRLQKMILKHTRALMLVVNVCASLECCISLALTAREYEWHRPILVDEPVIDVDKARHPLAELLCSSKFVPNPIRSGGAQTKVKLIIGPNASGKTVYLKQVGVIAYLAHIGSFVPAERAIIGPVDRILTRLHTVDCVLDGLSSFAKDIAQMAACLQRSTENSLIIIDEFGKGTLTEVGVSLLASCLNFWIDKGKLLCPHVFASSHFSSLPNFLHKDPEILSFHTMEVIEKSDGLEFQYALVDGIIDCSFAIYMAENIGIPKSVISRSMQVYKSLMNNEPVHRPDDDDKESKFFDQLQPLLNSFLAWDFSNGCDGLDFLQEASKVLKQNNERTDSVDDMMKKAVHESIETVENDDQNTQSECNSRTPSHNKFIADLNTTSKISQPEMIIHTSLVDGSNSSPLNQIQQSRNVSFKTPS